MGPHDLRAAARDLVCWRPFIERLHILYAAMDRAYAEVAAAYGFVCNGCEDNCCLTRFHHHTVLEVLDLSDGMAQLAPERRKTVVDAARRIAAMPVEAPDRQPCPLLWDRRCLLYAHRPMICRLHGLPNRLVRPDGTLQAADGCAAFHARCGPAVARLDRTPHYRQMAALEGELRRALEFPGRVHLTVAEMIATASEDQTPP
jgi:Fe-S-cluster containining protein